MFGHEVTHLRERGSEGGVVVSAGQRLTPALVAWESSGHSLAGSSAASTGLGKAAETQMGRICLC